MDKKKKAPKANGDADKIYKKRCAVYERVAITLFISAIFFVGLCLVFLKRPEFSEIEKRKLAEKPELTAESYFDGSFASGFTKYFSDTVPYREKLVELSSGCLFCSRDRSCRFSCSFSFLSNSNSSFSASFVCSLFIRHPDINTYLSAKSKEKF